MGTFSDCGKQSTAKEENILVNSEKNISNYTDEKQEGDECKYCQCWNVRRM